MEQTGRVKGIVLEAAKAAKATVHEIHATVLHLLRIDHEKLTSRHNGSDRRLTGVHGR